MDTRITYLLCLNNESAAIFCEPLTTNLDALDNDEIYNLIFAAFTQKAGSSDIVFSQSIKTLMSSETFDFMVYRIKDGYRQNCPDIDTWSMELEINEAHYDKLLSNLCQKVRMFHNSSRKRGRNHSKDS